MRSVEKLLKLASTFTLSANIGIILIHCANKLLDPSEIVTLSLSLIVTTIFGPRSSCEERLEADELLEMGSKTVPMADSWEERVDEGECRYFGLKFRIRRRFEEDLEGAELHVRRRFVFVLVVPVDGMIEVWSEEVCSEACSPEAPPARVADS